MPSAATMIAVIVNPGPRRKDRAAVTQVLAQNV